MATELSNFQAFPKIARLSRDMIITEKLDGTNAQIIIEESVLEGTSDGNVIAVVKRDGMLPLHIRAGSRTRFITPANDNYGFARWVQQNAVELSALGPGRHFGEWWGVGIQRGYELSERRFSLFNVSRWIDLRTAQPAAGGYPLTVNVPVNDSPTQCPACCSVVPLLFRGMFNTGNIEDTFAKLAIHGSKAAPGYMLPEGVVVFHTHGSYLFKKTFEKDAEGKGNV